MEISKVIGEYKGHKVYSDQYFQFVVINGKCMVIDDKQIKLNKKESDKLCQ